MEQARNNAKNIPGEKIPAVFIKEKKRGGRMAVRMDYDGFMRLYEMALFGYSWAPVLEAEGYLD